MKAVGLDHGNGHVKCHDGRTTVIFPSVVGPAVTISFRSELAEPHPEDLSIESGGRFWFVGELAIRQSPHPIHPRGQERDGELLRLLMLGALARAGVGGGESLRLITGLPVDWYLPDAIAGLQRALAGRQECTVNGQARRWTVERCEVYPQPFGAVAYEILRPGGDGSIAAEATGVIDIGHTTTNLALFEALEYIQAGSRSVESGMGLAYDLVAREVAERFGLELSPEAAEQATRTGVVRVAGQTCHIPEIRERALAAVVDGILAPMGELWGNARQLGRILIAGGGAMQVGQRLAGRFRQARVLAQPQLANAIGFQLYGSLL